MSVLMARFSALGDVAMTIPVIYSACRCYPGEKFTMLTRSGMAGLFINRPDNLDIIGIDVAQYAGLRGLRRLYKELSKQLRFSTFIDLHDSLRTRIFRLFCRVGGQKVSVIDKGRRGRRALTRAENKILLPLASMRARYRQAFFAAGFPTEAQFDGLYAPASDSKAQKDAHSGKADPAIFAAITPPKAEGECWIGIAPFAKHPGKIYPLEMMEEVVAEFAQRPHTRLFLFGGGPQERDILVSWAEKFPRVTSLAGERHGFAVELALMSHMDVMVSMDSANMHMASLTATPVVSIWGATHPYCGFKGWRQSERDIVQVPMACRPCSVFGNKPCFRGDYLCLRAISPQNIIQKINAHM